MKIFCITCLHFRPEYPLIYRKPKCDSPENTSVEKAEDTWRSPGDPYTVYERFPSEINSTNQCSWYKEDMRLTT